MEATAFLLSPPSNHTHGGMLMFSKQLAIALISVPFSKKLLFYCNIIFAAVKPECHMSAKDDLSTSRAANVAGWAI